MKLLIIFILVAFILGGFVGGEITDHDFSITGAVISSISVFAIILGLGWFFSEQERKRKKVELSPEIREIFDRMIGTSKNPNKMSQKFENDYPNTQTNNSNVEYKKDMDDNIYYLKEEIVNGPIGDCISKINIIIAMQLSPRYNYPKDAMDELLTSKKAIGYLFGIHQCFFRHTGLLTEGDASKESIEKMTWILTLSYKSIFGKVAGNKLLKLSTQYYKNEYFLSGKNNAIKEVKQFFSANIPIVGLREILNIKITEQPQDSKNKRHLHTKDFFEICPSLVKTMLITCCLTPEEYHEKLMLHARALGYIFGVHTYFLQYTKLNQEYNKEFCESLIHDSYQIAFGNFLGDEIFYSSLGFQDTESTDFIEGQFAGARDIAEYLHNGTPPFGLNRILILNLKE